MYHKCIVFKVVKLCSAGFRFHCPNWYKHVVSLWAFIYIQLQCIDDLGYTCAVLQGVDHTYVQGIRGTIHLGSQENYYCLANYQGTI